MIRAAVFFALLSFAAPLAAKEPVLALPIDCTLGQTCHIQQYVDRDKGPDATDYSCGGLSYDGHKGTDFALPNLAAMQAGVDVLAAENGIVTATRNHMPDIVQGNQNTPDVTGVECGNGVVIKHTSGWETQYCHLKQGSIIVNKGQKISKGDVIGQVGLSGKTEFPHLHLSLRKNGRVMDPFDADGTLTCDDDTHHSLWQNNIAYVGTGIISLGFDNKIPKYSDIKSGNAGQKSVAQDAPALVLWGYAYGANAGDVMIIEITGPKGNLIRQKIQMQKHQAQFFRAAGKRNKGAGWPKGQYSGTITILRNSLEQDSQTIQMTIK